MKQTLKAECHKYIDLLAEDKQAKREVYRWLGRRMHIKGVHISELTANELLYARRILKGECKRLKLI